MRVVFFGTPEFAVPSLDAVAAAHDVALVVAQPDRRAGRGMKLHKPAVAVRALELGLPLLQPQKIRDEAFLQRIADTNPDAGIVVAYGRILPSRLLAIPKHGFLNVHGSLLPAYRGAAPIQRSIAAGDTTAGVTIMQVDDELDHGPMYGKATIEIGPDERYPSVARRLAEVGAGALAKTLTSIERGDALATPQDHERATHAPKIEKEEGRITFNEPVRVIYNRFRAFDPWPGVFFESAGETIRIVEMRPHSGRPATPRTVVAIDQAVVVAAGDGIVRLDQLQRAGKPRASAGDIARGLGWRVGAPLP